MDNRPFDNWTIFDHLNTGPASSSNPHCIKIFCLNFQLKDDFDRGGQITLTIETGVHDVATLLKEFFRDLPEPIIPKDLHPALLAIQSEFSGRGCICTRGHFLDRVCFLPNIVYPSKHYLYSVVHRLPDLCY